MNTFQLILAVSIGILLSRGVYTLWEVIYVHKKIDKYCYFTFFCFGTAAYIFFELLLSYAGYSDAEYLNLHRMKILAMLFALPCWMFTVYSIYFKKSVIPYVFMCLCLAVAISAPFPAFLAKPISHIIIDKFGISFDYRFARAGITYTLIAIAIFIFFIPVSVSKFLRSQYSIKHKLLGICAFLPGIACFNDFLVSNHYIKNVLIAEYMQFIFIAALSLLFTKQLADKHMHLNGSLTRIKEHNERLKKLLLLRTQENENDKNQRAMYLMNFPDKLQTPVDEFVNDFISAQNRKTYYNHVNIINFSYEMVGRILFFDADARQKNITMDSAIDKDIYIQIDPLALKRLVNNLINNAIQYTEAGGKIYISLKREHEAVYFTIQDSGIGIATEKLSDIFNPDTQTEYNKTGMGLKIVKSILDDLHGKITIRSVQGQGSSFTIELPVYRGNTHQSPAENHYFLSLN